MHVAIGFVYILVKMTQLYNEPKLYQYKMKILQYLALVAMNK